MRIAVVGGGIAGLAAADRLARSGHDVVLWEGSDRVGGKLRLGRVGDLDLDVGAEAVLTRATGVLNLIQAAGLGNDIVHPAAADNAFTSATAEAHSPAIASVRGGLGRLPGALATSGRFEVRLKSTVRLVERSAARWRVAGESFDGVVVATPAPATGRIVASVAPRAAYFLAGVDYASVAVATFVLGDATLPEATGLAVRQAEGTVTTDAIFSTRKWPWLAEAAGELQVVRAAVGRPGETALLQHSDAEVLALAQTDVQSMIGTDEFGVVAASSLQRWGGALPQYDAGHGDLVSEIEIEIAGVPGLELCGAAYRGSGIAEVVAGAQDAADRLERTLGH